MDLFEVLGRVRPSFFLCGLADFPVVDVVIVDGDELDVDTTPAAHDVEEGDDDEYGDVLAAKAVVVGGDFRTKLLLVFFVMILPAGKAPGEWYNGFDSSASDMGDGFLARDALVLALAVVEKLLSIIDDRCCDTHCPVASSSKGNGGAFLA